MAAGGEIEAHDAVVGLEDGGVGGEVARGGWRDPLFGEERESYIEKGVGGVAQREREKEENPKRVFIFWVFIRKWPSNAPK